jgi:hypothetical protein
VAQVKHDSVGKPMFKVMCPYCNNPDGHVIDVACDCDNGWLLVDEFNLKMLMIIFGEVFIARPRQSESSAAQ